MMPLADTLAYVILPTEYHFIFRDSEAKNLTRFYKTDEPGKIGELMCIELGKFLLSYTKALNKDEKRRGPVFMKPFRREEIRIHDDFIYKLREIHILPLKFQLCGHPANYRFSSYAKIISPVPLLISTEEIFRRFSSRDSFIEFHNEILRSCPLMAA